jgi:predicted DNA-binding transcriptional regulator YafY
METVNVLEELSEPKPDGFNVAEYMNSSFSMFSGESEEVKLRFDNSLINTVIDRFGKDIPVIPDGDDHFTVRVTVKAEPPFFAWLFQFGKKAEIVEPIKLREKYMERLNEVIDTINN